MTETDNDHPGSGQALMEEAQRLRESGELDKSLKVGMQARGVFEGQEEIAKLAEQIAADSITRRHLYTRDKDPNQLSKAKEELEGVLHRAESLNNPEALIHPYFQLANVYRESGNLGDAVKYYQNALEAFEQSGINFPAQHLDMQIHLAAARVVVGDRQAREQLESLVNDLVELPDSDDEDQSYALHVWQTGGLMRLFTAYQDEPEKSQQFLKAAKTIVKKDPRLKALRGEQIKVLEQSTLPQ